MGTQIHQSHSASPISRTPAENNLALCRLEEHKPLLHSIATRLGVGEKESSELVEYTLREGKRNYGQQNDFMLKARLSKDLVHNCIFKISSLLFSHKNDAPDSSFCFIIPISFRTVYVLSHLESFTEKEIAFIVNITPMQVRERLARAEILLQSKCLNSFYLLT